MAITKIHPIKSTLKKAIDYIVDPAKTDDKLLVSSFGCAVETADLEFEKTRLLAMQKGNNLAHQLIQAFEPGEVSYAQAHEIGRQPADEILGGKYEYVIATHINKEHCHNHIIFCAVNFAEHKKYISNRKSYAQIRHVSDRLCRENGLSVVTPGAERGKQYAERDAQRKGTSYKQKLKIAIDRLIPISKDLDDLLRRLEAEGYEIKRGKYISFRAPGQERFTRAKTLGEAYTEEAIAERIKGKVILKTPKPERSGVSLLIDIENCIKAQQSAGYERWAKIENLKRAARTMVFLDQHGISHYTDLEQKITELQDSNEQTAAALKTAEHRLPDLALLIKHTATYKELKPLYSEYKKSHDKEKYLRGREREIILFEASARALKAAGVGDKLPDLAKLREEYSRLSEEKNRLYAEYCNCTKEYVGAFYSVSELETLFQAVKGDPCEFPVLMAAFYGLRRSEIMGLRWRAIDFENNLITIDHTVVQCMCDGTTITVEKDRTKNQSSCRSMPLVPQYRDLLLRMKVRQECCRKLCGNCYTESEYIFVNDMGEPYQPNYVTQHFKLVLRKNHLRSIRFHDLRHTCASLLLKNGVPMKDIQEWLGHSSYNTTANIYAHLDTSSKNTSASKMSNVVIIEPGISTSV